MLWSSRLIATTAVAGYVLLLGDGGAAQGFREQGGWQFRPSSQTQVLLNIEATRVQINGIGARSVGSGGTTLGLGSAALGSGLAVTNSPGNRQASSTTTANATTGTTTYNVTIRGNRNDVRVDGYLNLDVAQDSQGMESAISNQ